MSEKLGRESSARHEIANFVFSEKKKKKKKKRNQYIKISSAVDVISVLKAYVCVHGNHCFLHSYLQKMKFQGNITNNTVLNDYIYTYDSHTGH